MNNEPLLIRGAIAGLATVAGGLLLAFDATPAGDMAGSLTTTAYVVLPLLAWTWTVLTVRARVTPVEKPTDYAGNTLVPAGLRSDVGDTDAPLEETS
ncbi:hypothetical protein ABN034_12825 [Actinopolymorpha sp. B11F2]|uniref:hypothetical protein n=1 Tax=Actinopolymorpha sp. B11F2 TaxID=3160862 RepID=UPI0032E3ADBE